MLETMRGPQKNILIILNFDPKHKQKYEGGGICLRKCIRVSQMNLDVTSRSKWVGEPD